MNQNGFAPLVVVVLVALIGAGLYTGATTQILPTVPGVTPAAGQPGASASADINSSLSDQEKVTIAGNYSISDVGKVQYSFVFPKKGGEITGMISDTCNGIITGQVQSPGQNQISTFTGQLVAKCSPVVVFSFNIDLEAQLEGTVDFKSGEIYVIYNFTQPYSLRGSTSIGFTP